MNGLKEISMDEVKRIASKLGLKPAKIQGTDILRFAKNITRALVEISWDEFEQILKKNGLAVYALGTWMKIMRKGH